MHAAVDPIQQPIDFELPDQDGNAYRLSNHPANATVLVFYRGHWCPYCKRYLTKLQQNLQRFTDIGATLIAISPEPSASSKMLKEQLNLGFTLLSDTDGKVIEHFGVRNKFSSSSNLLLPHAAVVILDQQRIVKFKQVDRNYKKRMTIRALFQQLQTLLIT